MIGDNDLIQQAAKLISEDFKFDLVLSELTKVDRDQYQELKRILTEHLEKLIAQDFEGLLNLLYRIDVSEQKAKERLADNDPSKTADVLADLIIKRKMQKVLTRRKYKSGNKYLKDV